MDIKEMKVRGMSLKATVQVGRSGLTGSILSEIDEQLARRDLVKVKMLPSMGPSRSWKEDVEKMAEKLAAILVEIKGGTIILYRKGSRKGV
ncbi:MAG: YhbY family RNA-binding protein [Candidatus Thermoplasmatota archaeon]|nr:YhbY family RNA-binding protein [Candidatus Thermoplasmatota archaeon]